MIPVSVKAIKKAGIPPPVYTGGTIEKISFHPISKKWKIASVAVTSSISSPSSSIYGPSMHAFLNCYPQLGDFIFK